MGPGFVSQLRLPHPFNFHLLKDMLYCPLLALTELITTAFGSTVASGPHSNRVEIWVMKLTQRAINIELKYVRRPGFNSDMRSPYKREDQNFSRAGFLE